MNNLLKVLLAVGVISYVISPDLVAGPADDLLVAVLGIAAMRLKAGRA